MNRTMALWLMIALPALTATPLAAAKRPVAAVPATSPAPPPPPACVVSRVDAENTSVPPAYRDCPETPVMVVLPAGAFQMGDVLGTGSPYEKPVHQVRVRSFAIGRYEVTRSEWNACVQAGPCAALADAGGDGRLPVAGISWVQTQQYTAWVSARTGRRYRLPSEAEWEYAVRAGSAAQFTWGNLVEPACEQANSFDRSGHRANRQWTWQIECDDGFAAAAPVGSFPPNAWGLHDMLGNVWEWVADCWHADYENAPADGSAWMQDGCRKHVNRGGGWGNHPRTLRVSNRDGDEATASSDGLGFRVAREIGP